jgi:serine protease Do
MKNKLTLTSLLFILTLTVKAQFAELVAKSEKAVFKIFSYDEYGAPISTGTGFFIKSDGTALTNLHVLEDAKFAFIKNYRGETYPIEVITRTSEEYDIAEFIIKSSNKIFPYLTTTTNIPLKASDIFVIGNPQGLENTVTKGIISAIRQEDKKAIQISAPVSSGSSGSPIMDMKGNVFAIATYQYEEGQNLNFGYSMECYKDLNPNTKYKLANQSNKNLYILNKICNGSNDLILNSIEVNEKNTVLNFSYTSTTLAFGEPFIYTVIGNEEEAFYIEDKATKKRFYSYDATIKNSAKEPTYLELGETKRFKIYFPPINDIKEINIKEGMQGSDWSFSDISLAEYKSFSPSNKVFLNDFYFQTGLTYLSKKDYAKAYIFLKDYVKDHPENDYAQNLASVISHILGNKLDASFHINKAIELNPTNHNYYLNRYQISLEADEIDKALKSISTAIQLNSDQPELYYYRAAIYMKKEFWNEALMDLDKYLKSDREKEAIVYYQRAIVKTWLKDRSACNDFEKAYELETDKKEKEQILETYKKYCKRK